MDIQNDHNKADIDTFFHLENDQETIQQFEESRKKDVDTMDTYLHQLRIGNDFVMAFTDPYKDALPHKDLYINQFVKWWIKAFPPENEKKLGERFWSPGNLAILEYIRTTKDTLVQNAFLFFSLCANDFVYTFFTQERPNFVVESELPPPKVPTKVHLREFIQNVGLQECNNLLENNFRISECNVAMKDSALTVFFYTMMHRYFMYVPYYIPSPKEWFTLTKKQKKNPKKTNLITYDP